MNTRFSMAPCHALHIGHAFIARANWALAKSAGAKFFLHLHDGIYQMKRWAQGTFPLPILVDRYVEDLAWLGMEPDEVIWSTRNAEAHAAAAQKVWCPRDNGGGLYIMRTGAPGPECNYHPWWVLATVVDDHEAEVGGFYRGVDLIGQMQLYDYFCRALGWKPPMQCYLPTIRREADAKKINESDRGESIRDLREAGYSSGSIHGSLNELQRRQEMEQHGEGSYVIPAGYLTGNKVRPLEYDDYYQMWEQEQPGGMLEKQPYEQEVRLYLAQMRQRLKKGRQAKADAALRAARAKEGGL